MRLKNISSGFTKNEWTVLQKRAAGKTLKDVGDILGVTPARVRQIEQKVFKKLRHPVWLPFRPEVHKMGLCKRVFGICECENKTHPGIGIKDCS